MKIGILGGTFDPIHNGHLMLGRHARDLFDLDEIWVMPNGMPPHKSKCSIDSLTEHRVEMIKRAIASEKKFTLQLYEVERKEVHYSYLTMEYFKTAYPEHEFYFIIGADSLFTLEKWKCPDRLLRTCVMLAAYRDGKSRQEMLRQIQYLNHKYDADIRLLETPDVDISSTEIKEALKLRHSIQKMVPQSVYEYICEHDLFKEEENESR